MATLTKTHLIISIGSQRFGIPMSYVDSVLRMDALTPIPLAPGEILGIINMHGSILPVLSLKKRLGLWKGEKENPTQQETVVCVHIGNELCGLCVDQVERSFSCVESQILPSPKPFLKSDAQACIAGMYHLDEETILILNIEQVLTFKNSSLPNIHEVSYEIRDYRPSSAPLSDH
jgi:purine-binding chemotaxis protein CheW